MKVKFGKSALTAILLLTIALALSSEIAASEIAAEIDTAVSVTAIPNPVLVDLSTTVTCQPSTESQGSSVGCTATVSDKLTTPTGKVTWTQKTIFNNNGGNGDLVTFSSTSCTLKAEGATSASCSVRANTVNPGETTITGVYSGNLASADPMGTKGTFKLTVIPIP